MSFGIPWTDACQSWTHGHAQRSGSSALFTKNATLQNCWPQLKDGSIVACRSRERDPESLYRCGDAHVMTCGRATSISDARQLPMHTPLQKGCRQLACLEKRCLCKAPKWVLADSAAEQEGGQYGAVTIAAECFLCKGQCTVCLCFHMTVLGRDYHIPAGTPCPHPSGHSGLMGGGDDWACALTSNGEVNP